MTIALALAAAVSWGTADFLAGLAGRRMAGTRTSLLAVPTSAQLVGLALVSIGFLFDAQVPSDPATWILAGLAGVGNGVGVAALYYGLAVGQMAIVAPVAATVTSVAPVVLGLAAGERPSPLAAAGIVLAILAAVLVSRVPSDPTAPVVRPWRSVATGTVAGLGLATLLVLLDHVGDAGVVWSVVTVKVAAAILLLLATALVASRGSGGVLTGRWEVVTVGALDALSIGAYQWAVTNGLLTVVAVVASLYPVGTVVLARVVLWERLGRLQAVGVLVAAGAVALMAMA